MAEFRVFTPDETEHFFHGDSRYTIKDGGVLEVQDEQGPKTSFGPAEWLKVVEPEPPRRRGVIA